MDIRKFNRETWDKLVQKKDRWTVPVSSEEVENARKGNWDIILTPSKAVPKSWFPNLKGTQVLCLASGGGQQGPILAAAGAQVTVFDNSPEQLAQDTFVAKRDGLSIRTVEGDMRDLSAFEEGNFDLIFHPCSNCFAQNIQPVWDEAFRVLRAGGTLLSGFSNPVGFLFDPELEKKEIFQLRFSVPFSDLESLSWEEREKHFPGEPLTFGHSLDDQIGGQIQAGFHIVGFFEDDWNGEQALDRFIKGYIATRALKPK